MAWLLDMFNDSLIIVSIIFNFIFDIIHKIISVVFTWQFIIGFIVVIITLVLPIWWMIRVIYGVEDIQLTKLIEELTREK